MTTWHQMPSDDIYNIHNTNFNRTPHVTSLIPRIPPGKPKSNKAISLKPKYNRPVNLPKHIYNMLRDDVKQELDRYNEEKKAQYKPTCPRMAKVHEQDHDEADHPENPELDLEIHLPDDSYPMQDSDIEDLLETHGHYSAKMASTYHDRIFTIKLGLSQSLIVHEGTHSPNVTLKGYPKKFWGLFGQKAQKTQQITLTHPKREVILNPNELQTDLQP